MDSSPLLSVVICTHNPRPHFLAEVLAALQAQSLPLSQWQLLLIDNASSPPLNTDLSWHPNATILREDTLGTIQARLRAIRHTHTPLLLFVDDDNVLDPSFLQVGLHKAAQWPQIGCFGGQLLPRFETPPPEWTKPYWPWLAIQALDRDLWSNLLHQFQSTPAGAGMFLRREVLERYLLMIQSDPRHLQLGAVGSSMMRGDDSDLAFCAIDAGYGTARFRDLQLCHLMPAERLHEDNLVRLVEGTLYSSFLLQFLRDAPLPEQPSRLTRLFQWLQARRLPLRQRRFYQAEIRARKSALEQIKRWQSGDPK